MLAVLASISLSLSLSAFAGQDRQFTYQAQVVARQADCVTEAQNWGQKFASATGAKVKASACRSEQTLNADGKSYRVYNLGLSYTAASSHSPYSILIGKGDVLAPIRLNEQPIYPTMDSCLAEVALQKTHFEKQTGLQAVTATCVTGLPFLTTTPYYLKIDGFEKTENGFQARPKKQLYTFAPQSFDSVPAQRQGEINQFLTSYEAVIVKEGVGSFIYYRAGGSLPVNAEDLAYQRNQQECEAQIPFVDAMLAKSGSKNWNIWCHESRLQTIHEGGYFFTQVAMGNTTQYASFQQCVNDIEFVLSDSRFEKVLGALCGPSIYDSANYEMTLYRRSW